VQFRLAKESILTATEFENTDLKEIEWLYSRLIRYKQDEHEQIMKAMHGKDYTEHIT